MKRSFRLLLSALATISSATLVGCSAATAPSTANQEGLRQVGAIRLPTANGSQRGLADFHGNIVMLHFFASWCVECGMEAPSLQSVANNFQNTKFTLVGVAVDDDPFSIQTFIARNNLHFPILLDIEDHLRDFFQVKELPVTIFLDKTGTPIRFKDPQSGEITAKLVGARAWDTLEPVQMIAGLVESKQ